MHAGSGTSAGTLPPLRFLTLGPLEVHRDGRPLDLGPPLQRALLAALLVDAQRSVPVSTLLDRLWPTEPPSTAAKSVQKYVSNLRRVVGVERIASSGGYRLVVAGEDEIDATAFEAAPARARAAASPAAALEILDDALASWRGEPYADLVDAPFLEPVRRRAEELRLAIVEERLDALLTLGEHDRVIADTAEPLADHPSRERLWQLRAAALAAGGRQGEALEVLRELRARLAEHLGIDPAPATQELERRILAQEEPTERAERATGNLPAATTEMIGREVDLDHVLAALGRSRLVTLTGPGGVGKTTLAIDAARRRAGSHLAGAWLVELGPVTDPERVARRTAEVLGVHDHPTRPIAEHLALHLRDTDPLLVMDNCEHLLEAAASLAGSLLHASAGLRVIATSRQPLGVPGETVVPVDPLPVPPAAEAPDTHGDYASVRLLTQRAREAGAQLDPAAVGAELAAICRQLDGIPLAIELAAARLRAFSPAELATRLADRVSLLADTRHDGPSRHQTLEATIGWSHQLLGPDEQAVFARLSVFRGGFRIEAADAVCGVGDVATSIAALVDRSLLAGRPTVDGGTRFRMLETIRRFAEERLGSDDGPVRARHAAYFVSLARAVVAAPDLREPERLLTIGADYENLRAALAFLLERGDVASALGLAVDLSGFWSETGALAEGQSWLERVLAADDAPPDLRVRGLLALGGLAQPSSSERALETAAEAVAVADGIGDDRLAARARQALGRQYAVLLDRERAVPLLEQAIALFERLGDDIAIADCYEALGVADRGAPDHGIPSFRRAVEVYRRAGADGLLAQTLFSMSYRSLTAAGLFDEARAALDESLAISMRLGSRHTAAHAMSGLGQLARLAGDRDEAVRTFRFALEEFRAIDDRRCIARMQTALGRIATLEGSDDAWPTLRDAIGVAIDVDLGPSGDVAETVDALVLELLRRGEAETAARWLGAADAARDRFGIRRAPPDEASIVEARGRLVASLGTARAEELRGAGAARTLAEVAAEAAHHRPPR